MKTKNFLIDKIYKKEEKIKNPEKVKSLLLNELNHTNIKIAYFIYNFNMENLKNYHARTVLTFLIKELLYNFRAYTKEISRAEKSAKLILKKYYAYLY